MLLSKHSLWWRRFEDVLKTSFVFVFRRRLQDALIKTNIFTILIRLQKTSWRRLEDVFKTSSRLLAKASSKPFQDVFKTSCKNVFKTPSRRFQDIFKTSSRRIEDVFNTSLRHLQDVLQRCLEDAFKAYHQVILFLLTSFQDVFRTYSQRFWGVLKDGYLRKDLPRSNFWEIYGQC